MGDLRLQDIQTYSTTRTLEKGSVYISYSQKTNILCHKNNSTMTLLSIQYQTIARFRRVLIWGHTNLTPAVLCIGKNTRVAL